MNDRWGLNTIAVIELNLLARTGQDRSGFIANLANISYSHFWFSFFLCVANSLILNKNSHRLAYFFQDSGNHFFELTLSRFIL